MATLGNLKLNVKVVDHATPVLRRLGYGLWLASHTTAAIVTLLALVAVIGLLTGVLIGERL